ncbi:MAG TPA: phosphohydrolase [Clostridiales bacterium]|nr:phosphohydrolase [Clostridiales bacterium]
MPASGDRPVTLELVKRDPEAGAYLDRADEFLGVLGFTEHGRRHAGLVASIAANVLTHLDFSEREVELGSIGGYLHDIGNVIARQGHEQIGALLVLGILRRLGMTPEETAAVVGAIGNHGDECEPVSNLSAALFLADKSDVHRSRVRNPDPNCFDIHDRVNHAVQHSFLRVDGRRRTVTLELKVDSRLASVMNYFEIFLGRMSLCRKAADFLGCRFELAINEHKLL